MKKFWILLLLLIGTMALSTACSSSEPSVSPSAVQPEAVTQWPENEFTSHIPQPQSGTMDYVCDYSDSERYQIVMKDISQEESDAYMEMLKEEGYTEIASDSNESSTGTLLQKDTVTLSIAYSDDVLNILITEESST